MSSAPQFVGSVNNGVQTFANADGTAWKTIWTPGALGGRIEAITIASNDTSAVIVILSVLRGGVNYVIGQINIAAVGADVFIHVNALLYFSFTAPMDGGVVMPNGDVLQMKCNAAVTAGKQVDVNVIGGDF